MATANAAREAGWRAGCACVCQRASAVTGCVSRQYFVHRVPWYSNIIFHALKKNDFFIKMTLNFTLSTHDMHVSISLIHFLISNYIHTIYTTHSSHELHSHNFYLSSIIYTSRLHDPFNDLSILQNCYMYMNILTKFPLMLKLKYLWSLLVFKLWQM